MLVTAMCHDAKTFNGHTDRGVAVAFAHLLNVSAVTPYSGRLIGVVFKWRFEGTALMKALTKKLYQELQRLICRWKRNINPRS